MNNNLDNKKELEDIDFTKNYDFKTTPNQGKFYNSINENIIENVNNKEEIDPHYIVTGKRLGANKQNNYSDDDIQENNSNKSKDASKIKIIIIVIILILLAILSIIFKR